MMTSEGVEDLEMVFFTGTGWQRRLGITTILIGFWYSNIGAGNWGGS